MSVNIMYRYAKKNRKTYTKCHIATNVDTRLILNIQAQRGLKHDIHFVISSIRQIKKFKLHYIVIDKVYDSEFIRNVIFNEINSFDIIPNKPRVKTGKLRLRSRDIFRPKVYYR